MTPTHHRPHRSIPAPTDAENRAAVARAQAGDVAARNWLIERNEPLVVLLADRFRRSRPHLEMEDLIQVGCAIGLPAAIRKFRPELGFKFSTYLAPWVRQAFQRYALEAAPVRLPAYLAERLTYYRQFEAAGEPDPVAAVARRCNLPPGGSARIREGLAAIAAVPRAVGRYRPDDDASDPVDLAPDPAADPSARLEARDELARLLAAMEALDPAEWVVLVLGGGLFGLPRLRSRQVAGLLARPRHCIPILRRRALARLRLLLDPASARSA
jgi:RNA polymerase sigma factor (sigma-70 family)